MYYNRVPIAFYYILLHYAILSCYNTYEIPNKSPYLLLLYRVGLCEYAKGMLSTLMHSTRVVPTAVAERLSFETHMGGVY